MVGGGRARSARWRAAAGAAFLFWPPSVSLREPPPPMGGVITLTKHNTTGSASDRQAGATIEITEAMISAGVEVLCWEDVSVGLWSADREIVRDVFLAMLAAANLSQDSESLIRQN